MTEPKLENIVTVEELAEFLGVPAKTIKDQRTLPSIRLGRQRLYFRETVAEWLKERERV